MVYFGQLTNDIKKALSAGWALEETLQRLLGRGAESVGKSKAGVDLDAGGRRLAADLRGEVTVRGFGARSRGGGGSGGNHPGCT